MLVSFIISLLENGCDAVVMQTNSMMMRLPEKFLAYKSTPKKIVFVTLSEATRFSLTTIK
jgi:hypothetical protein